jgi:hypothetical protein
VALALNSNSGGILHIDGIHVMECSSEINSLSETRKKYYFQYVNVL